ncbi:phosphoribosylformylglycinamidine cyclo-ligase [bacterium BMS3Abin14]|nr:phosphoribosylformylglycinamidine cyclo-ligase [bacterium BMS3Abin14]
MKTTRYSDAGVDIAAANEAKKLISSAVNSTHGPSVLEGIGGFGGLFSTDDFPPDAVLVSSVDGVGTKLKLAFLLDRHGSVGVDLVNHCVNDILVQGARAIFFMDYLATGRLDPAAVGEIVGGMAAACRAAGCALLGGETAEMPGFYAEGEYDLAGTIVGVVGRKDLITGRTISNGDVIIGLGSSGLHTNGYSLARKVLLENGRLSLNEVHPDLGKDLGTELLEPHRCYAPSVLPILGRFDVRGMVHITGGGFAGNIPRVVPGNLTAVMVKGSWPVHPVFPLIAHMGNVSDDEMYRVFNMGLGFLLIVPPDDADGVSDALAGAGEQVCRVGSITGRKDSDPPVIFD